MNREPMSYQTALQRVTALCASSEHCCQDIQEKLQKWGVCQKDIDTIITYLLDEKYIDEERFCRAFAKDKMRYCKWGRQKIDQHMRMLGLCTAFRQQALNELPEEEYLEILTQILQSKARSVKARNSYERNAKLMRFALGRGFEMSLIRECLPEQDDDDNDMDGEQ